MGFISPESLLGILQFLWKEYETFIGLLYFWIQFYLSIESIRNRKTEPTTTKNLFGFSICSVWFISFLEKVFDEASSVWCKMQFYWFQFSRKLKGKLGEFWMCLIFGPPKKFHDQVEPSHQTLSSRWTIYVIFISEKIMTRIDIR